MSTNIHSEPDSSDSSSISSDSGTWGRLLGEERSIEPKIPLSTSIVIDRLPSDKKAQLEKTLQETENHENKITIRFLPIGATPAVTPKVFKISANQTVSTLIKFLTKKLKIKSNVIYLYISSSFQPNPDEKIGDLYQLFKVNNELIVNYCNSIAFG